MTIITTLADHVANVFVQQSLETACGRLRYAIDHNVVPGGLALIANAPEGADLDLKAVELDFIDLWEHRGLLSKAGQCDMAVWFFGPDLKQPFAIAANPGSWPIELTHDVLKVAIAIRPQGNL